MTTSARIKGSGTWRQPRRRAATRKRNALARCSMITRTSRPDFPVSRQMELDRGRDDVEMKQARARQSWRGKRARGRHRHRRGQIRQMLPEYPQFGYRILRSRLATGRRRIRAAVGSDGNPAWLTLAVRRGRGAAQAQGRKTVAPVVSLASRARCASAASASGYTWFTAGCTAPCPSTLKSSSPARSRASREPR